MIKIGGIYKITNIINKKIYIGKSKNIQRRINHHIKDLNKNKHYNTYLQTSWNKYGECNFLFETIFNSSIESELDNMECYYIKLYNSNNPNFGYNLTSGGDGGKHTPESVEKMKLSARGKGSKLTMGDVRKIKMLLYCSMDRKEIVKIFKTSKAIVDNIAMLKSFSYILEELNSDILKVKQKIIEERNKQILNLFDSGLSISEIVKKTSYSTSIVEKCAYKFTQTIENKKEKYQEIYDKVFEYYNNGVNKYQISKILNISPSTVGRYLSGRNNPYDDLPFKKITEEVREEILKLYFEKNKTFVEISEILKISRTVISGFIFKYKYANTEVS